ncbi:MAG: hypothetical protein ACK417_08105 [Bacteroidia bacterium]
MKKLIIAVLLICVAGHSQAQSLGSQVGEATKEKLNGRQSRILSADRSNIIVLHQKKADSYELHAFDADLKLEASYPLKMPGVTKKKHDLVDVLGIEDKLVMITSFYDESEQVRTIYAWKLEAEGTFDSEFVIVDEIKGTEGIDPRSVIPRLGKSEDAKLFYYFRNETVAKGEAPRLVYKLFDSKLAIATDRVIATPFKVKTADIGDIIADGSDHVYMTAKVQDVNMSKRPARVELPYYWTILNYDIKESKLREYPVNLGEGTFVHELTINLFKSDDKLHAAGFYGASQRSGLNGSFITTTDVITHQVLRKTVEPLDKAFTEIHKATQRKFVDTNIPRKVIRGVMDVKPKILVSSNGNVYLIGEIYRVNKEVPKGQQPSSWPDEKSTITHYIQGMMVVNFNARGSVEWQTSMAINQAPVNEEGASISFITGMVRDKVAFIYNDHPANANISDPNKKESMIKPDTKNSSTFIAYVDKYGKLDADVLWYNKEDEGIILPYSAFQLNRTQVLALAHSPKGTYRLVKLTFY